ncbi:MAG: hypothetical protein AMJ93_08850 [Anaerolineae bacterium SM23_84]|nr:MAG: hypothetical protein AMJ93_08850 [Anaerolineae bacterium SM23_84]
MIGTAQAVWDDKRGLTMEHLLYAVVLGLALAVRVGVFGRWPLRDQEAGLALSAWRFARGLPAMLRGHSPLLFHVNALLFFLTDGSDALARLLSVLFGSSLVVLPYGLRGYLGRTGALAASVLLALSPSMVYFSWAVDGSVIVAFCALGLLVVGADLLESHRPSYAAVATALLVLALMAGPSVYTLLAILLTFPVALRVSARQGADGGGLHDLRHAWCNLAADADSWRRALSVAATLFLAAGLGFVYNPMGLQMALDQFGKWVGDFHFVGTSPWYRAPLLLLLYEGLPLFLGIVGFVVARKRRDVLTLLLRYWLIFALILSVLPGYRPPSSIVLILLPLVLAAGQAAEYLTQQIRHMPRRPLFWGLLALSLTVTGAAYVQLATYLSSPASTYLLRIAALSVFAVSAYAFVWSLVGPDVPLRAAAVWLLLLLLFGWIRAGVRLNYRRADDVAEPMVVVSTSPQVLELSGAAARLSSQVTGDERTMTWRVDEDLEVPLGWYLRRFERVSYVREAAEQPDAEAVILPAGAPAPSEYVGLRFALRSRWVGGRQSLFEWLRWWTEQKSAVRGQVVEEAVVLWVKKPPQ